MAAAMPGAQGLFGAPQLALNWAARDRVSVNRKLKDHLCAFACLAADVLVGRRPTHLTEIIPQDPSYFGATDAGKAGMGGVHCDAEGSPGVWRVAFPTEIQDKLVSANNPTSTITNSDLQHTSTLAQVSTIAARHPV